LGKQLAIDLRTALVIQISDLCVHTYTGCVHTHRSRQ